MKNTIFPEHPVHTKKAVVELLPLYVRGFFDYFFFCLQQQQKKIKNISPKLLSDCTLSQLDNLPLIAPFRTEHINLKKKYCVFACFEGFWIVSKTKVEFLSGDKLVLKKNCGRALVLV